MLLCDHHSKTATKELKQRATFSCSGWSIHYFIAHSICKLKKNEKKTAQQHFLVEKSSARIRLATEYVIFNQVIELFSSPTSCAFNWVSVGPGAVAFGAHISFRVSWFCLIDEFDDGCGSIVIHSHSSLNLITFAYSNQCAGMKQAPNVSKSLRCYYFQLFHNNIVSMRQLIPPISFSNTRFAVSPSLQSFCNGHRFDIDKYRSLCRHCVCISEQSHSLFESSDIGQMKTTAMAAAAAALNTDLFMAPFAHYPIRIRDQTWKHLTSKLPTHTHMHMKKESISNLFRQLIKHTQFMCWFVRFTARKMSSTISLSDEEEKKEELWCARTTTTTTATISM